MHIPPLKVVFGKEDILEIQERLEVALSNGALAQGKNVEEFEHLWANYAGTKHAVAVNSGSSAIEIPARIRAVEGKEVLVPVNTFAATAMGVLLAGGRVRFVDTDPSTFSMSLKEIKARRTAKTVGVIVVHIGGIITPEIEAIHSWCDEEGLWLLEDCAHAHGSRWNGKGAGTFGFAGSFSFFATKVMTTGEGGMIVTDDDQVADQARLLRNHGKPQPWVSYHTHFGSNCRMSELNAILGLSQLKRLDEFIAWREKIARFYTSQLSDRPELTRVIPAGRSSWYKYILLLPKGVDRAKLKQEMKQRGISLSGEVYEMALHRQPIFAGMANGEFPNADDVCSRHICLPLYYGLTEEEAGFVIDTLLSVLKPNL
jgi:perosamine synthetase